METKKYNYIDIHTHNWAKKHSVTELYNLLSTQIDEVSIEPDKYYTVGIHPWHLKSAFIIEKVKQVCEKPNVLAVGEFGIDRAIDTDIDTQTKAFIEQLELAMVLNKPAVIHCVRGYSDVLAILKRIKPHIPIIFHDFNDTIQTYRQLLKYNSYFSFGKKLMDVTTKAHKTFKKIDLDRIFLETDTSYIAIEEVYTLATMLRKVDIDALMKQCYLNFNKCFTRL